MGQFGCTLFSTQKQIGGISTPLQSQIIDGENKKKNEAVHEKIFQKWHCHKIAYTFLKNGTS